MAYFPNASAGSILDAQCYDCIHGLSEDALCPVAAVQMNFNYDQCGNKNLRDCLNVLVSKEGTCQMKKVIDKCYKAEQVEERPKYKGPEWGVRG